MTALEVVAESMAGAFLGVLLAAAAITYAAARVKRRMFEKMRKQP